MSEGISISGYTGRVTNWPLFGTIASTAVAVLVVWAVLAGHPISLLVIGLIVAATAVVFTSVSLSIGAHHVVIRLGPFGFPMWRIAADRIEWAEALELGRGELGGWGLHFSPWRGARLTIRSGATLRLHLVGGGTFAVSADHADTAAAVVNAWNRPEAAAG